MQRHHRRLTRRSVLLATAMSVPALAHATFDKAETSTAYVKVKVKVEARKRHSKVTQGVDLVLPVDQSTYVKLPPRDGSPLKLKLQPQKVGPSGLLLNVELSSGEPAALLHKPDMRLLVPWDKATSFEFGHHDGETISLVLLPSTLPSTYEPPAKQGPNPAV